MNGVDQKERGVPKLALVMDEYERILITQGFPQAHATLCGYLADSDLNEQERKVLQRVCEAITLIHSTIQAAL